MFRKYTYKQKIKALLYGLIPILFICYKFSIEKTLNAYQGYHKDKALIDNNNLSMGSQNAAVKQKKVEEITKLYALDTSVMDRNFLNIVDQYCSDSSAIVKEYKPLSLNGLPKIWTRTITLEGKFNVLLSLIYNLEQKIKHYRISSVYFKSYLDKTDNKTKLSCNLYLQNIYPSN